MAIDWSVSGVDGSSVRGDGGAEREALHFRHALEEILEIARAGMREQSLALSLGLIEGKAQNALASTKAPSNRRGALKGRTPRSAKD